jgi:hypothetical protein
MKAAFLRCRKIQILKIPVSYNSSCSSFLSVPAIMQNALKQSRDKKYFSVGLPPFVPFEVFRNIVENSSPS